MRCPSGKRLAAPFARGALGEHRLLFALVDSRRGVGQRVLRNEGLEQRLAVLGELHHAGEDVHVLVGLARRAPALAVDLQDEQLGVHLHEHAFALDDLLATHIGAHFQALTD